MGSFQMNNTDRYLLHFKDKFASVLKSMGETDKAALVSRWDGTCDSASYVTGLISTYLVKLKKYTFEDELGTLYSQVPARWIEQSESDLFQEWYDDINTPDSIESYNNIASKAMNEAITLVNDRTWGELQTIRMEHPLSVLPIIGDLLGLHTDKDSRPGTPGTLNASFSRMNQDGTFEVLAGPSWRFVVDFADVDKASFVLPAGTSGNPMSEHFMDFYNLWKKGEKWVVPFPYNKVKEKAASSLILAPRDNN